MPGLDGLEVLRRIKEMDPDKEVIVATAFGEMALAVKALQLDAAGFITKPVSSESLALALQRAMERSAKRKDILKYTALLEDRWMDTAEELARSFQFQKMLIEGSIDGIAACNKQGKVIIYNRSMEKMLGYPAASVIGKMSLLDFFWPGEAAKFQEDLYSEERGGKDRLFPFRSELIARDGSKVSVLLSATVLFQEDEQVGMVVFFRDLENCVMRKSADVSKMKHLEEETRKCEENYRSIFDNIPNPVFILDRKNLKVFDCNKSVKDVYGYSREELKGTSFLKLFDEGEQQNYALELRNSETMNHARQMTKDGRSILVNIRVSPYEYNGRQALLATSSDIIQILMVKQQLVQANKMATLGEMATSIAHELNQPLSVIKTASSFMLNKAGKRERLRDETLTAMVEEIDSHVDRASTIVAHVREFGRKSEASRERVQVNVALQKAIDIFSQQLKLREIEVVKELDPDLPLIMGDLNRLEQVFINLLINARDAIEEKREKRKKSSGGERKIFLRTSSTPEKVRIEIQDTGIGIPAALLDRIFEPFFTTKEVGKGTGLGLSISYGIVQDYHGTVHVQTVENEGSTFIIHFPIRVQADGG